MLTVKYLIVNLTLMLFIILINFSKALAQVPFNSSPSPAYTDLIWTNPWTAYDPAQNDTLHVSFVPGTSGQSPYFQQQGFSIGNPYARINWYQPFIYNPYAYGRFAPNSLFGLRAYGGINWYLPYGGYNWFLHPGFYI